MRIFMPSLIYQCIFLRFSMCNYAFYALFVARIGNIQTYIDNNGWCTNSRLVEYISALSRVKIEFKFNWVYWCFTSHATIFQSYMWRHRCAGGLKKKLYLRSGSQRHRHFAGFFNVPFIHRHRTNLFIRWLWHTARLSRLLRHAGKGWFQSFIQLILAYTTFVECRTCIVPSLCSPSPAPSSTSASPPPPGMPYLYSSSSL